MQQKSGERRFDDGGTPHLPGPVPVFNVGDATEF